MQPGRLSIVQVLDSVEEEASGPSYSVPRLCDALAHRGHEVVLLTVGKVTTTPPGWAHEASRHDLSGVPVLGRLRFSQGLRYQLHQRSPMSDVVHSHALWRLPSIYAAQVAARYSKPFLLSPRGMLGGAALRFSPVQKKLFWTLAQGRAARSASCIHATSGQEYEDIRAFGLTAPVAIVPNGIDVPQQLPPVLKESGKRTLLFLGRVHPKKGVHSLLEAWARLGARHPEWELEIVGPVEGEYGARIRETVRSLPRARLLGPLYGPEKAAAYRAADLFVLPTSNENFGMTVAESLAQGTPVICSKGAPWSGLVTNKCGWWIDQGVDPLVSALDAAMRLAPQQLSEMGEAGRRWMDSDFRWEGIAHRLSAVYQWLAKDGPLPDWVVLN